MAIHEDPEGRELAALETVGAVFDGRRVVEIGCGDGRLTRRYAGRAASVTAIDPDVDAVAELAGDLPGIDARAIPVEQLILPDHSVDLVVFAWSL
jgi:2-polyprenyl-3-methyl-5-hydroxy-6-metoxy-1,4-benzoquinol methylase